MTQAVNRSTLWADSPPSQFSIKKNTLTSRYTAHTDPRLSAPLTHAQEHFYAACAVDFRRRCNFKWNSDIPSLTGKKKKEAGEAMKRCINELMFYGRRVHRRFTVSFSSVCCETLIKLQERLQAELRGEKNTRTRTPEQEHKTQGWCSRCWL